MWKINLTHEKFLWHSEKNYPKSHLKDMVMWTQTTWQPVLQVLEHSPGGAPWGLSPKCYLSLCRMNLTIGSLIRILKREFQVRYQAWLLPPDQNLTDLCYGAFLVLSGGSRTPSAPGNSVVHFEIFCNHPVFPKWTGLLISFCWPLCVWARVCH